MASKLSLAVYIFTVIAGVSMVLEVKAIPHGLTADQLATVGVTYSEVLQRFERRDGDGSEVRILLSTIHFSIINVSVFAEYNTAPCMDLCILMRTMGLVPSHVKVRAL